MIIRIFKRKEKKLEALIAIEWIAFRINNKKEIIAKIKLHDMTNLLRSFRKTNNNEDNKTMYGIK